MRNIASIDLNLLKAFDALLYERRVKLAAMRVGITPAGDEQRPQPPAPPLRG